MRRLSIRSFAPAAALAAALVAPVATAAAQTLHPSFQPPRTVQREYNAAVADSDVGTTFLFQWTESITSASAFRFDGGLLDVDGVDSDVFLALGATYLRQLNNAGADIPLDLLLTVGGHALVGDEFALELPVGVSAGRRFPLEGALAITPYVHPRVAFQYFSEGDAGESDTDVGLAFDIGVDFEVSSRLSLRGAFMFGSDDVDGIGFGLAWRPSGLRR